MSKYPNANDFVPAMFQSNKPMTRQRKVEDDEKELAKWKEKFNTEYMSNQEPTIGDLINRYRNYFHERYKMDDESYQIFMDGVKDIA